jgi:hypothetical protein
MKHSPVCFFVEVRGSRDAATPPLYGSHGLELMSGLQPVMSGILACRGYRQSISRPNGGQEEINQVQPDFDLRFKCIIKKYPR